MKKKERSALEGIPHICNNVCAIWGSPELETYINTLIMDSRDGKRSGLPMDMAAELAFLVELNKLRRAMDMSSKLKISLKDAEAKLERDSAAAQFDAWGDPRSGGAGIARRPVEKPVPAPPPQRRREEKETAGGIVFRTLTNKFFLIAIILLLTLNSMWDRIKVFF